MAVPEIVNPEKVQEFKETVRRQWTDADAVTAWAKWHEQFAYQTRFATQAILEAAQTKPGMRVLDLASGSGEPALALARAVGPAGHVIATDISPGMVEVTAANALRAGLTNMSFMPADAEALSFGDERFDAVTCRFGIMFCPDYARALREIRRVLKPAGRAAFTAWQAFDQPLFQSTVGVLLKYRPGPPPEPGAPTPFVFARRGSLSDALHQAGFQELREESLTIPWPWPGPVEQLWQFMREASAPVWGPIFASLAVDERNRVNEEVYAALRPYFSGQETDPGARIILASATR